MAEILFCPRNFYYRVVENAQEENEHVLIGKHQEQKRSQRAHVTRSDSEQHRSVFVVSERLGLSARLDVTETHGDDVYPVEYKKGPNRDRPIDQVQLCAQGMLLEEHLGREVPYGYLYYVGSKQRVKVQFTSELRAAVIRTVERAREILHSREIPPPVNDRRCLGCSLYDRCLPGETMFLLERQQGLRNAVRPRQPTPGVNLGRVLYVDQPGSYIRKTGERLVIILEGQTVREVPLVNIDELVLVSRVQISQGALQVLLERGMPVTFLSASGRLLGHLQGPWSGNGVLRLRQSQVASTPSMRLEFARRFVFGKLRNQRLLLLRRRRQVLAGPQADLLDTGIQGLDRAIAAARRATALETLLGIEGGGTRAYFASFGALIQNPEFEFPGRHRRPPTDPVNSLLSFAYSMLTKNALAAVQVAGLDPYVGLYHVHVYGRPALALDLLEEFRPLIADSVVLGLLNRRMLKRSDFRCEGEAWYLSDAARRTFFAAFENRLSEELTHPLFGYQVSYRRMLELQARFLAKAIMGEFPEYEPLVLR